MYILNWVFTNGHQWSKEFTTENDALDFMNKCGFLLNYSIDKVWISTSNENKNIVKIK